MEQKAEGKIQKAIPVRVDPRILDLVEPFLKHRRKDVATLRRLLQAKDFSAIQILGHDLKGTGSVYGFKGMTRIGISIERVRARPGNEAKVDELASLIDRFADYLGRVKIVSK